MTVITAEQIRAARMMLHLTQKQLSQKAGISNATLNNIERGVQKDPKPSTMQQIAQTLADRGILFVNEDNGMVGVCMRPPSVLSNKQATVMIIDDCDEERQLYETWLKQMPDRAFAVAHARGIDDGLTACKEENIACIVLDFCLREETGLQFLKMLKASMDICPPVIMLTGMQDEMVEQMSRRYGVTEFFYKHGLLQHHLCNAVNRTMSAQVPDFDHAM